jgi:hypothetical protein
MNPILNSALPGRGREVASFSPNQEVTPSSYRRNGRFQQVTNAFQQSFDLEWPLE